MRGSAIEVHVRLWQFRFDGKLNKDIIDNEDLRKCSQAVPLGTRKRGSWCWTYVRSSECQWVVRYTCALEPS